MVWDLVQAHELERRFGLNEAERTYGSQTADVLTKLSEKEKDFLKMALNHSSLLDEWANM